MCHMSVLLPPSMRVGAETPGAGAEWHSVLLSQAASNENEHWLDLGMEKCLEFLS